ncbi:MAG TPA: helix-turn-helix domain-containing protein [Steroidobacteraceae bacterium]|nr:helix-turn-helix domain-containing protein [Steroidobacteraceae bacterium]
MSRRISAREGVLGREIPAYLLYGEPAGASDSSTFHVETIAARSALLDWKIGAHRHRDLHQVMLIQRGRVTASLDMLRLALKAPALVIVPPGCVHAFHFQAHSEGLVLSLSVRRLRIMARELQGIAEILETPLAVHLDPTAGRETDLDALAAMLLREFARSAVVRESALDGLLAAFLANVLRLARPEHSDRNPVLTRELELVARFREQIGRHYRKHTDIARYARQLGASETRLRRACRAVAGESPIGMVQRRLLVEAERQLRYTSMTVSQVAWYLGFKDPSYFSRFFQRARGTSPRSFRRAVQTGAP